jgi:hypothetical protein
MVLLVYFLILGVNAIVLGVVSPLGWPPVMIGLFGCAFLLLAFSMVSCSDPGIIYKNDYDIPDVEDTHDQGKDDEVIVSTTKRASTIECGQCELRRPFSGHHCHYCKVCVNELDHHCPWCGKCIGKENIKYFWLFVYSLNVQFYYLIGVFIYYMLAFPGNQNYLPKGPGFS